MMWCFFGSSTLYIIIHTHYCIAYYITSSYIPFIIEHKSSSTLTCCFLTAKISRDLSNYLQRYLWWWPQLKLYTYIIYTYNNHIYIYTIIIYIYTHTRFFRVDTVNCQVGLSGRRLAELSGLKKFAPLLGRPRGFTHGTISPLFSGGIQIWFVQLMFPWRWQSLSSC